MRNRSANEDQLGNALLNSASADMASFSTFLDATGSFFPPVATGFGFPARTL